MIEVVLIMGMTSGAILSIGIALVIFLVTRPRSTDESTTPTPTTIPPITLTDGSLYTLRDTSNRYIGHDFDPSRGRGKMCDAAYSTASGKPFKFTKDGDVWTISTDCDDDGNWTSYLTARDDTLIGSRDKGNETKTQRWSITCDDSNKCTFSNKKDTKTYYVSHA
jgi:hypothetical protein